MLDRGNRNSKAMSAAIRSTRSMMQISVLSLGAILVLEGVASPGTMIAASVITGRILLPFEQLVDGWRQWVFAAAAWRRVRNLVSENQSRRQSFALPRPVARLDVDRLVYVPSGAERPVIKGVSFSLDPGDVLAVVGPSGAGKSTLARLLAGIDPPGESVVTLPTGSPSSSSDGDDHTCNRRRNPIRLGLSPTPCTSTSDPSTIAAAASPSRKSAWGSLDHRKMMAGRAVYGPWSRSASPPPPSARNPVAINNRARSASSR